MFLQTRPGWIFQTTSNWPGAALKASGLRLKTFHVVKVEGMGALVGDFVYFYGLDALPAFVALSC